MTQEERREANRKRFERQNAERDALAAKLRLEHLPDVHEGTAKDVFNYAWEEGHANGKEEVGYYYSDVASIVKDALLRKGW